MNSFAQAYQDLYVLSVLDKKRNGTYLDIGCYVPKEGNNTHLLDSEFGWDGLNIDKSDFNFSCGGRTGRFVKCNATEPYPVEAFEIRDKLSPVMKIDYLSLDVDEDTNNALLPALVFAKYSVITIEHDLYARGIENQKYQRNLLRNHGYALHVPDVFFPNNPQLVFEDWWLSPELASKNPQLTEGPHDAAAVVQNLWLEKFGEDLNLMQGASFS
jgi:hypothetical protein